MTHTRLASLGTPLRRRRREAPAVPDRRAVRGLLGCGILGVALALPANVDAQPYRFDGGAESGTAVGRDGSAIVVEAAGPSLFGRRVLYRPAQTLELRNRWLVVQDSTFGVVFGAASGVKAEIGSYDGDVRLRALDAVRAVEVRALVFNVWNEMVGYVSATFLDERSAGASWVVRPRWSGVPRPDEHRTSITWIHRVMFDDESVLESDLRAVAVAWSLVTGRDYAGLPEDELVRAGGR